MGLPPVHDDVPALRRARAVLFSDIDDTFVFAGDGDDDRRQALARAGRVVRVVFVSSRTPIQMLQFQRRHHHPGDFIAENGAFLVVRDAAMADAIGHCVRWPGEGLPRFVRRFGRSPLELVASIREILDDHPARRLIESLNRSAMTGYLAARSASLLVPASLSRDPVVADALDRLAGGGLKVLEGGRWVAIWDGPSKGDTARRYLTAFAAVTGRRPLAAAIGNAADDEALLMMADVAWSVPGPDGEHASALRNLPGVRLAARRGCQGWGDIVTDLTRLPEETPWPRTTAGR